MEVPILSIHFSQHFQGRLDDSTIFVKGDFGKLTPVIMGLKADQREVVLATESWDEAVPQNLLRTSGSWSNSGE